jgi:FkbM family methyltransferase
LPRKPLLELSLRLQHPVRMCLRRYDRGDHASFFENFFELPVRPDLCPRPAVIADAGAHIGCFSLMAHSLWPDARIVAFEPEAANVELLRRNFELNHVPGEVVPKAVWKEPGRLQFAATRSNGGFLLAGNKRSEVDAPAAPQMQEVEATSLSAFFGSELGQVDLLKLDIEGAELQVLESELSRLGPETTVLCELHFSAKYQRQFEDLITAGGWHGQVYDASHPPHSTWVMRRSQNPEFPRHRSRHG